MPSHALDQWTSDRAPRLRMLDAQCAVVLGAAPHAPTLADDMIRAYAVLISGQFQGFCRDLYSECVEFVVTQGPTSIRPYIRLQFGANLSLNRLNATENAIGEDFQRFIPGLSLRTRLPSGAARLNLLNQLNLFRNNAAHGNPRPSPFPSLPTARSWQNACSALAADLDRMMYSEFRAALGFDPWPP